MALGIVYAIGQLSVYGVSTDAWVTRLAQAKDLAQYCFEDSVQRLRGQPAHQLLMALALFAKSAAREAIAQIAFPEVDFNDQLHEALSDKGWTLTLMVISFRGLKSSHQHRLIDEGASL